MRITARPLAPGEIDYELLWFCISVGGLIWAAAWLSFGLPWLVCWFRELTGHPCATCGLTRSAIAFFHGDLASSIRWNPLAFLIYCGIAVFDAYALGVLISRARRLRVSLNLAEKRMVRAVVIAALILNWVYLLAHSAMFKG